MQNVNNILDVIDVSSGSGPSEPVTLEEMTDYLRLNGFVDTDDSTSVSDFTDDNTLIEELITTARVWLENQLGISIIEHDWKAVGVTNEAGYIQLPFGPVTEINSILNSEGDTVDTDNITLIGDNLKYPNYVDMTVNYTAGFTSVPSPLVTEIKRIAAYLYEHRGDEDELKGYQISSAAKKFNRVPYLF